MPAHAPSFPPCFHYHAALYTSPNSIIPAGMALRERNCAHLRGDAPNCFLPPPPFPLSTPGARRNSGNVNYCGKVGTFLLRVPFLLLEQKTFFLRQRRRRRRLRRHANGCGGEERRKSSLSLPRRKQKHLFILLWRRRRGRKKE